MEGQIKYKCINVCEGCNGHQAHCRRFELPDFYLGERPLQETRESSPSHPAYNGPVLSNSPHYITPAKQSSASQ